MNNATHLGLDRHKDTVAVALDRPHESVPDERTIPNTPEAVRKLVRGCSTTLLVACYESGPTGYETYRLFSDRGGELIVGETPAPAAGPRDVALSRGCRTRGLLLVRRERRRGQPQPPRRPPTCGRRSQSVSAQALPSRVCASTQ
jgi:hypothetical protein